MDINKELKVVAALQTCEASTLELIMAQMFGEKKTRTDAEGTVTVSKWRGKYYMLNYAPPQETEQRKE